MGNPFGRHTILIEPGMQARWAFLPALAAVSGIAIGVGGLLLLPFLIDAFSHQRTLASETPLDALSNALPWLLLCALVLFGLNWFLGVYNSHRVAGPLHRLVRILDARNRGEAAERIQLRPNDQLRTLADLLNTRFAQEDAARVAAADLVQLLGGVFRGSEASGNGSLTFEASELKELRHRVRRLSEALEPSLPDDPAP